jgi:hypothetical protein
MKKVLYLLAGFALFTLGCNNEDIPKEVPNCIKAKIEDIKEQAVWNPPAKIYSYKYNNETVYYIPPRCCDIMSTLYDENCNIICYPDGGIAGNGDGLCPDFFTKRTGERLIWEDDRK